MYHNSILIGYVNFDLLRHSLLNKFHTSLLKRHSYVTQPARLT